MQEAGLTNGTIAAKLGFHRCTIGRELKRNCGSRGYRPNQAQELSERRQDYRFQARRLLPPIIAAIDRKLKIQWSPEQIYKRFQKQGLPCVSTETIYKHIAADRKSGGFLWRNLRYSHKRRKRRFPQGDRRGKIQDAVSIHDRPSEATKRKLGHWERDSMLGKERKGGLLVMTERKSRFNKIILLQERKAPLITNATIKLMKDLPCKTITNDRGLEFFDHKNLSKKTKIPVYFCDPYSSYQRGTNENRIGVIRQYIKKGTKILNLSKKKLKIIEDRINHRPMKCLDWKTPYEVLYNKRCTTSW